MSPVSTNISAAGVRVFSNVIARRRDPHGNPLPRRHVFVRPLVTSDPEATAEAAEGLRQSPLLWLRVRSALASSENCQRLRAELEEQRERHNQPIEAQLHETEECLEAIGRELDALMPRAAAASAKVGLPFRPEAVEVGFSEDEPLSLDELAGLHHLLPPSPAPSRGGQLLAKLLGICGGAVFGVSLGLLTGKLALADLSEEIASLLLWCGVGAVVMLLVGSTLSPLARRVGTAAHVQGVTHPRIAAGWALGLAVTLVCLSVVFVAVEAKTEQLGLFRALTEESILTGFRLARPELLLVSLMLCVPAVASYVVGGLSEGERLANLARLRALQREERACIRKHPTYATAVGLHEQLRVLLARKAELNERAGLLRSAIRHEPSEEELRRLEDCEMDAVAASWAAEDALQSALEQGSVARPGCLLGPVIAGSGDRA